MTTLTREILQRVFDRRATAGDLARLPALYRGAGTGLTRRLATAGMLRLALRWPTLGGILIVALVVARIRSRRRHQPDEVAPAR